MKRSMSFKKMKIRKRKISRELILEKGAEILSQKSFFKTKIEDITRALSIGKGTFYLYFKSKEELLREIMLNLHREIFSINKKFCEKEERWDIKFKSLIRESLIFVKNKIVFIRVFVQEGIRGRGVFEKKPDIEKIFSIYSENQRLLTEFFKEGIKKKFLSYFYKPEELALFFDFILRSRITKYIFNRKKFDLKKEEQIFYRFFFRGAGK